MTNAVIRGHCPPSTFPRHSPQTDSVAIGVRLQSQARLDVLIPFLSDKLGEDETKSVKKLQEDLESDLKKVMRLALL